MAPEQLHEPKTVDSRTDIWALGVVLFELLAGHGPFAAETLPELVHKVATSPPASLASVRPEAAQLDPVIARCLAKDRTARYATVAELAQALLPLGPERLRPSVERISRIVQGSSFTTTSPERASPPGALRDRGVSHTGPSDPGQASAAGMLAVGRTTMGSAHGRSARRVAVVVGVVAAGCVAGFVVWSFAPGRQAGPHPEATSPVLASHPPTTIAPVEPHAPLVREAGQDEAIADAATASTGIDAAPPAVARPPATDAGGGGRPVSGHPVHPAASVAPPTCTVVTDYDAEGQPHFRKVCK
jgi:serine/threonine-protein kinase